MTAGPMRRHFSSSARAQLASRHTASGLPTRCSLGLRQYQRTITDLRPCQPLASKLWFTSAAPQRYSGPGYNADHPPPDERTIKLGKTLRILQERLPSLLASPLPQDILSPHISLQLFPSTHPHLPTVSGKIAYTAALWTAPVAWGRVPVVGNVRLEILSERMVKNGGYGTAKDARQEKLIVRWKTCAKAQKGEGGQLSETLEKITKIISKSPQSDDEFSGLFIFEFDEEGRILNHIIEHIDSGSNMDRTAKFISVTDWLLGRAWGRSSNGDGTPGLAFARCRTERAPHRRNFR